MWICDTSTWKFLGFPHWWAKLFVSSNLIWLVQKSYILKFFLNWTWKWSYKFGLKGRFGKQIGWSCLGLTQYGTSQIVKKFPDHWIVIFLRRNIMNFHKKINQPKLAKSKSVSCEEIDSIHTVKLLKCLVCLVRLWVTQLFNLWVLGK